MIANQPKFPRPPRLGSGFKDNSNLENIFKDKKGVVKMKVKCIDDLGMTILEIGSVYEGELKFNHWCNEKRWYLEGEKFRKFCFWEEAFEIVEEDNNMQEKTFREVIADIKEGEIWESNCRLIKRYNGKIEISNLDGRKIDTYTITLLDETLYKLQRKQYSFEEAFKAYEDGIKVESVFSGVSYEKLRDGTVDIESKYAIATHHEGDVRFLIGEIRGKWYINN